MLLSINNNLTKQKMALCRSNSCDSHYCNTVVHIICHKGTRKVFWANHQSLFICVSTLSWLPAVVPNIALMHTSIVGILLQTSIKNFPQSQILMKVLCTCQLHAPLGGVRDWVGQPGDLTTWASKCPTPGVQYGLSMASNCAIHMMAMSYVF